jgi:hypothetical protein
MNQLDHSSCLAERFVSQSNSADNFLAACIQLSFVVRGHNAFQQHCQFSPAGLLYPDRRKHTGCRYLLQLILRIPYVVNSKQIRPPAGVDCSFRPLLPEWQGYCGALERAREQAGTLQV